MRRRIHKPSHKFQWRMRTRLKGEVIMTNDTIETEARKVLVEGIEMLLDSHPFRSHAYYPAGGPIPKHLWNHWFQARW